MKTSKAKQMSGCPSGSGQPATGVFNLQQETEEFVNLIVIFQREKSPSARRAAEAVLSHFFGREEVAAMMCLLEEATERTVRRFAQVHLFRDERMQQADVSVVIRPIRPPQRWWGNTGRYGIFLEKAGREAVALHFTNQASAVYYLMFLIHKCQVNDAAQPLSLRRNRQAFMMLYHRMYDIPRQKLHDRVQNLLFRRTEDGSIRAGRLNEVIYDIRRHVRMVMEGYDEGFQPYVMTARTHLRLPSHLIRFEDEASLLPLEFVFE